MKMLMSEPRYEDVEGGALQQNEQGMYYGVGDNGDYIVPSITAKRESSYTSSLGQGSAGRSRSYNSSLGIGIVPQSQEMEVGTSPRRFRNRTIKPPDEAINPFRTAGHGHDMYEPIQVTSPVGTIVPSSHILLQQQQFEEEQHQQAQQFLSLYNGQSPMQQQAEVTSKRSPRKKSKSPRRFPWSPNIKSPLGRKKSPKASTPRSGATVPSPYHQQIHCSAKLPSSSGGRRFFGGNYDEDNHNTGYRNMDDNDDWDHTVPQNRRERRGRGRSGRRIIHNPSTYEMSTSNDDTGVSTDLTDSTDDDSGTMMENTTVSDTLSDSYLDPDSPTNRSAYGRYQKRGRGRRNVDEYPKFTSNDEDEEVYIVRQRYGYCSILFSITQVAILGVMMWQCGVAPLSINPMLGPYPDALSDWGGKNSINILEDKEYWRLVTPIFLHAGVIHLLCNVAVQIELGVFFEREWGSPAWLIIYIGSAIGASMLSVIFMPNAVSVGSSGAVMGLFGGKLAEVFCRFCERSETAQERIGHQVRKEQCAGVMCSVIVVMAFSFIPYVDWSAHLGGLVSGIFIGLMVFSLEINHWFFRVLWFTIGALLTLVSFILAWNYMFYGDVEVEEELRDVCGYYQQFFDDYECNCMRGEHYGNGNDNSNDSGEGSNEEENHEDMRFLLGSYDITY